MKEQVHPAFNVAIYGVMFAGIFLTMAGLVWIMRHYTAPPPPDTDYWAQRARNLSELNAQNKDQLQTYGWVDATRGVARLPIIRAMELNIKEWENPAIGRSNFLARVEKMAPVIPALPGTNGAAGSTNGPAKSPATNAPAGVIAK